jgi:hypothetical protein
LTFPPNPGRQHGARLRRTFYMLMGAWQLVAYRSCDQVTRSPHFSATRALPATPSARCGPGARASPHRPATPRSHPDRVRQILAARQRRAEGRVDCRAPEGQKTLPRARQRINATPLQAAWNASMCPRRCVEKHREWQTACAKRVNHDNRRNHRARWPASSRCYGAFWP